MNCPSVFGEVTQDCRQVLLELLHRVAAHAGANGMDAGALGEVFAPCIAWLPPPPKKVAHPSSAS